MTHRLAITEAPAPPISSPEITTRAKHHVFDLTRAILADPTLLNEIPDGVTLVRLPDDDLDVAAEQIEAGWGVLREGRDVLFRHVRPISPRWPNADLHE